MLKWQKGRRNPYYNKMLLFKIPRFMDCWLIKYSEAVGIGWHTDKVTGKKHYRLNIVLKKAGDFMAIRRNGSQICDKRVIFFRPDIDKHTVKCIGKGKTRLVLSIGWVI